MSEKILLPKLAMAMKQGKIVEWKIKEGEWVKTGDIVMVIETEKVTYEWESSASGYLHILSELGKIYPVEETVALLAQTEEELKELQAAQPVPEMPETGDEVVEPSAPTASNNPKNKGRIKITPIAKKLAKKHNLDLEKIPGTGPGGRIKKEDILQFLEKGEAIAADVTVKPTCTGEMVDGKEVLDTIPYSGMRQAIGDHMMHSLAVSAQLSNIGEIDMTQLIRFRKSYLKKEKEFGVRITYTDLIVMLLAKAIKYVPIINASLVDGEIKIWKDINIGVAVSFESGKYDSSLIVPVIKNTESKSLLEIANISRDLITRARNGRLTPDEVTGGTITLTNLGALTPGWMIGTPIINQPQAVIIGTGAILEKPVGVNGKIELRPTMTVSFTYDHRVMDGAPIAKFYTKITELADNPEYLLA